MMLRQELQVYFDKTYPKILIKSIPSFINKPIHIRFELGDDKEKGTIERVNQSTDRAFQMYDDRGCFIWSDKADKIRDIYVKRNDWIVDYHRPAVDTYFSR